MLVYFMTIWFIIRRLEIFYDHLVYFTAIGNILWPFCIFCGHLVQVFPPVLVCWTKKNLATLAETTPLNHTSSMYVHMCVMYIWNACLGEGELGAVRRDAGSAVHVEDALVPRLTLVRI
jgi:hypothetical protein